MNEAKLAGKLGATAFRAAVAEEIVAAMGAKPGSLGAVTATRKDASIRVFADEQLRSARGMTTGANEDGFHLRHVDVDRDIRVDVWADLRTVRVDELAVETGLPLKIRRAIEVGHVFKLGTKYSEKLESSFLDVEGQRKPTVMGCYGIGITRTLQAVIEQCHDKDGIVWPMSVAPYQVLLTPLGAPGSATMQLAEALYQELTAAGLDVLLDDRDERPGFKFKDADLIGIPLRVSVGEKSLAKGEVELKARGSALQAVRKEDAAARVIAHVREALTRLG